VVTEYELPWLGVHVHDVYGDPEGNIWFNTNRSPFLGKLDPKTGRVTSYRTPPTEGRHPGGHWLQVGKDGTVWFTENWADNLVRFDPRTEAFKMAQKTPASHNMGLAPNDETLWRTAGGKVTRFDPETGKPVEQYPLEHIRGTAYGNFMSWDGRYYGGGSRSEEFDGIVWFDRQTKEVREVRAPSGVSGASRGSFDPMGTSG
jgi:streptogramin lyase